MPGPGGRSDAAAQPRLRLDKWLWQARFFKTRGIAAEMIESGRCRINGQRSLKPGHGILVGDVLTFIQGNDVRIVRVLALGLRRGPATEAQELYHEIARAERVRPPDTLE